MFRMKTETQFGKGRRDWGLPLEWGGEGGAQPGRWALEAWCPPGEFDSQVLIGSRGLQEWQWVPRGPC